MSSSRGTLVVRTDGGLYQLYVFDRDTTKPATIADGSTVKVVSEPGSEPGVGVARNITVSSAPSTAPEKESAEPVPAVVRQLERDLERQVRRFGAGFRAGAVLDPKLLLVGVHARMGPSLIEMSRSVRTSNLHSERSQSSSQSTWKESTDCRLRHARGVGQPTLGAARISRSATRTSSEPRTVAMAALTSAIRVRSGPEHPHRH